MKSPPCDTPKIEIKFNVSTNDVAAVRANPLFADQTSIRLLTSTYFDTHNHHLQEAGVTLRVRSQDDQFIQTVKRQVEDSVFARDVWEHQVSTSAPDPSCWRDTPVAEILGEKSAKRLIAIFTINVERTERLFAQGEDAVAISLDRGKITAGDSREFIAEIKFELKAGDVKFLFNTARRFAPNATLRLLSASKSERGFRLAGQEAGAAFLSSMPTLRTGTSSQAAFAIVTRSCLAQITNNAQLFPYVDDAEVLHQLRIGTRRLRAALRTFEPMLLGEDLKHLASELRWLGRELDPERDFDVFCYAYSDRSKHCVSRTEKSDLDRRLKPIGQEVHDRTLCALQSSRFAALLLDSAEWTAAGAWRSNNDGFGASLRTVDVSVVALQTSCRLRRQINKSGRKLASLTPELRHKLRIRAKNLTYNEEFFDLLVPKRVLKDQLISSAALMSLQDALGNLNDLRAEQRLVGAIKTGDGTSLYPARRRLSSPRRRAKLLKRAEAAFKRWKRADRLRTSLGC